jgi:RNA polymerase sigma factor (sigma-70 family)
MVEMHEQSDVQLLRDYAEDGHEAAFRELVTRHADFVFSAALRQVNSPDLAGDIAQGVFTDLARKARPLAKQMPGSLAGWLHRGTRYAALNHLRDTRRRLANERQAMEQLLINSESAPDWELIRPVLDEALDSLGDEDREALLLRYFKNQDFRAVGLALGVSDDTAQKRVSRAMERLREFFSKRNVTIGTSGLAVLISANAVQSAPAGLAATLSAAAVLTGTAVHTSTIIAATKTIVMTTLQKTLIIAALTAAVGTGIFEAHQASQLREQNQTLQQAQAPLAEQIQELQREHDAVTNQLAGLLAENSRLKSNPNQNELLKLRGEVGQLRRQATEREPQPAASASTATAVALAPTTEAEFETAKRQMFFAMERVQTALRQFVTNNPYGFLIDTNGQPNPDLFANFPGLPLDNLEIKARDVQGVANALDQNSRAILAASKEPIFYNGMWTRFYLLADGTVAGDTSYSSSQQFQVVYPPDEDLAAMRANTESLPENLKNIMTTMDPVVKAFSAANNGKLPDDPAKLAPYASTSEQQAALQQMLQMKQNSRSNNPAQ